MKTVRVSARRKSQNSHKKYSLNHDRLYRSGTNSKIAGVAAGLAEYFRIDPTIVRLVFVILTLINLSSGVILYGVLWIILPIEPNTYLSTSNPTQTDTQDTLNADDNAQSKKWVSFIILTLSFLLVWNVMNQREFSVFIRWLQVIIILFGIIFLTRV